MRDKLQAVVENRINNLKNMELTNLNTSREPLIRKMYTLQSRGANLVKLTARGTVIQEESRGDLTDAIYEILWNYSIEQDGYFYLEEELERRKATFKGDRILHDEEILVKPMSISQDLNYEEKDMKRAPIYYDRRKAVQYAERWWNAFNPQYPKFADDCTNFISQCLQAGGIPMWGAPDRTKGWWMRGNTWSFSWAVAHAFQIMLKGVSWTREVEGPEDLLLGDIICYDFEGDGRFNHNTIITGWDAYGRPLVNAHTTNSRLRYWTYEDSTAYTPNLKYRFFHILAKE